MPNDDVRRYSKCKFHPHAKVRLAERGATESEVEATIAGGERFAAKFGRTGFRRNFSPTRTAAAK